MSPNRLAKHHYREAKKSISAARISMRALKTFFIGVARTEKELNEITKELAKIRERLTNIIEGEER